MKIPQHYRDLKAALHRDEPLNTNATETEGTKAVSDQSSHPVEVITQSRMVAILLGRRKSPASTELFLNVVASTREFFYVQLYSHTRKRLIGYARFDKVGVEEISRHPASVYELAELLGADYPTPSPLVSLSGTLWPRRVVLEQLSAGDPSLPQGDWTLRPGARLVGGEIRYGI